MPDLLDGLIIKAQSGFFTVHTDVGDFVCQVRGRLKQERRDTDLVAVGDRVRISLAEDRSGMIEEVAERERALARLAPSRDHLVHDAALDAHPGVLRPLADASHGRGIPSQPRDGSKSPGRGHLQRRR